MKRKRYYIYFCLCVVVYLWTNQHSFEQFSKPGKIALKDQFVEAVSKIAGEDTKADTGQLNGPYEVVRVVDGDTIIVLRNDEKIKVRLIGVDTPESVHSDISKNSDEGKEVSEWLTSLLTETEVYLEYDISMEDRYGRTLAYVYLEDGKTMINRQLLEAGYAKTMTVKPNNKYTDEFQALQTEAKKMGAGFWGTGFF